MKASRLQRQREAMSMKNISLNNFCVIYLATLILSCPAQAMVYPIEETGDSVVGEFRKAVASHEDTLLDIARRNGLGYEDIKLANPEVDTWLPGEGVEITLPTRFVLPQVRRRGIVLNIPEMRLYYFPKESSEVITYPLGIGREGWSTPYENTRVIQKSKNPYWYPPKSIREEHEANGDSLPKVVKPGPDNPLGDHALRLDLPGYLIHGTNKPFGIGMRVSHGCIRLYPEDIEKLFDLVKLKTPVSIINQPYKIGQSGNIIYLEAHPFLEEDAEIFEDNLTSVVKMLVRLTEERDYEIDWDLAKQVIRDRKGIPIEIGYLMEREISEEKVSVNSPRLELTLENQIPAKVRE